MTYGSESNTESFDPQRPSRSQESHQEPPSQESVKSSTRCDGSRHSVLETLGQTQSGGDDGGEVGYVEFKSFWSINQARREIKYRGEQTWGVRVEYYVVQTTILICKKLISNIIVYLCFHSHLHLLKGR